LRNLRKKCKKVFCQLKYTPFLWGEASAAGVNHRLSQIDGLRESSFGSLYRSTKSSVTSHEWLLQKETSTLSASIAVTTFFLWLCLCVRDVKLQATGRESSGGKAEFQD
jgi:hypothetical protein